MSEESRVEAFENNILPEVREDVLKVLEFFEKRELPSAYTACVQMYLANFMGFQARVWSEHCIDYGVEMEFEEIAKNIENIKSLDQYVSEYS